MNLIEEAKALGFSDAAVKYRSACICAGIPGFLRGQSLREL